MIGCGALAAETTTPLKGLNNIPVVQFPTVGSLCYGLDPLAMELRVSDQEVRELVMAGLTIPAFEPGSAASLRAFIRVSDHLVEMNAVNCLDRIEVAFVYFTRLELSHSGDTFQGAVVLQAAEAVIVGGGRDDFLARRKASIAQLMAALGQEWKRQNSN